MICNRRIQNAVQYCYSSGECEISNTSMTSAYGYDQLEQEGHESEFHLHLQLHTKVKVRPFGLRPSRSWRGVRRIRAKLRWPIARRPLSVMEGSSSSSSEYGPLPRSPPAEETQPLRMSKRGRPRMKTVRLGGSRKVRLQRSLENAGRWISSVSCWAGVHCRSKAKMGLSFLREAMKLLITGLHAPATEMSMTGYHIGPYLDEVVQRRLEMYRPIGKSRKSSGSAASKPAAKLPTGWDQSRDRIILISPNRKHVAGLRRNSQCGLDTIAESALEMEVRV